MFRDDRDALAARVEALEVELQETKEELKRAQEKLSVEPPQQQETKKEEELKIRVDLSEYQGWKYPPAKYTGVELTPAEVLMLLIAASVVPFMLFLAWR